MPRSDINYTLEELVQTYGDGFYDGFKKAMEIQEKVGEDGLYTLLDYKDIEVIGLSEDAESKFEDVMIKVNNKEVL